MRVTILLTLLFLSILPSLFALRLLLPSDVNRLSEPPQSVRHTEKLGEEGSIATPTFPNFSLSSTPIPHPPPNPTPLPPSAVSPAINTWAIRMTSTDYFLQSNSSVGLQTLERWTITSTSSKLHWFLGSGAADRQQQSLDRYVRHVEKRMSWRSSPLNHSHHHSEKENGKHHKDGKKHYNDLSSFYLRHAQCRACTQHNLDLLKSTSLIPLPSYVPHAIMKFCHFTQPLLPHEQPPSAYSPLPLQDWEGVCMPAEIPCPSSTIDLNVLSPTTCANDVPAMKQSCALCVMDGYEWQTHRRAVKGGDNYDGQCVASTSSSSSFCSAGVCITSLDECPSAIANMQNQRRFQQLSGAFFLFIFVAASLCCCLGLRRCCAIGKARLAARRSAVAIPIEVPVVSSAASASVYPAQAAAANEHREARVAMQEPLLSSGLNPPFYAAYPPAYGRV